MKNATTAQQVQRLPSDCTVDDIVEQLDVAGAVITEHYTDLDTVQRIGHGGPVMTSDAFVTLAMEFIDSSVA